MTDVPLANRAYWVASSAYKIENSAVALQRYNQNKEIGAMIMELYSVKQRTLKAVN